MYHHLPNLLTILRLLLAAFFFVILNLYRSSSDTAWTLWMSIAIFILAGITDGLDGFLARRWKVETTFGRIMDPFCDKVLVIGAFVYLSGPRFVDPRRIEADEFFTMASGVYPWMIALILARELLVTGIRGAHERQGIAFATTIWGKLKMLLQLITIPFVIGIVALDPSVAGHRWMAILRDVLVYATVIVTVLSGLPYIASAAKIMRSTNRLK